MSLYQNTHRIESIRWKDWNYSNEGCYSITICTHHRFRFFGHVENATMILNEIGFIVQDEWLKTPGLRPDMNIMLDKFGVMPDHFHGIIFIGDNEYNDNGKDPIKGFSILPGLPIMFGGQAVNAVGPVQRQNDFGPQSKNLSSIIRGFKSAVTTRVRPINKAFKWQARYHDNVVRDYDSLERIRDYIDNNPANWIE